MTQICSHSEICNTLILLSCVQVGVQSVPFCFHAGTTLKDGQIIIFMCILQCAWDCHWIDYLFFSELLMIHGITWRKRLHYFVDMTISVPGKYEGSSFCYDKIHILLGFYCFSFMECYWVACGYYLKWRHGDRTKEVWYLHQVVKQNLSHKGETLLSNEAQWKKI